MPSRGDGREGSCEDDEIRESFPVILCDVIEALEWRCHTCCLIPIPFICADGVGQAIRVDEATERRPCQKSMQNMISDPFKEDDIGRTSLFYAVAKNDTSEVESIIFKLSGTGLGCQRYALIAHMDHSGMTAVHLAEKLGYIEIGRLLSSELGRMEFFE